MWNEYDPQGYGVIALKIFVEGEEYLQYQVGTFKLPHMRFCKHDWYRIGSVTKTFTTTIFLLAVQNKYLKLHDKLYKWYPQITYSKEITLGMLGNMTSGIADPTNDPAYVAKYFEVNPFRQWDPQEIIAMAIEIGPLFIPGTDFFYSNVNTIILGSILEKTFKCPLSDLMSKYVLNPLCLNDTALYPLGDVSTFPSPKIHSYEYDKSVQESTLWNPSFTYASGAMVSKIDDMSDWSRYLGTGALLSREIFALRLKPTTAKFPPYSLDHYYGIGIIYTYGWLTHFGSTSSYNDCVTYLPEKKITIVLVNNYINVNAPRPTAIVPEIWTAIANIMNPERMVPPPETLIHCR